MQAISTVYEHLQSLEKSGSKVHRVHRRLHMDTWNFDYTSQGDDNYEKARCRAVWNGAIPNRFPKLIVYPEVDRDIQAIVEYANAQDLTIGVKSGGHSWSAAFLRDGGILVDLVKMNHITLDVQGQTAEVQPAAYASTLNASLLQHKLMFPGGHCPTVGMGGYLLQGGFGWNSRKWGMACESVLALDLVTANGNLVHADKTQNSEYFWAARGAGCGFFGIVTRFYLKLHPLPEAIMTARYIFEIADLDEVLIAIDNVSEQISTDVETCMFVAQDQDGFIGRPTVAITLDAFSDSDEEARGALGLIHNLSAFSKAIKAYTFISCTLKEMMDRLEKILDNRGRHYQVDNMWTNSPLGQLLPSFHKIVEKLPPAPAHLYMTWWRQHPRPDMAFSMEARLYIAMYVISDEGETDIAHAKYVRGSLQLMEKYESGIQLADENLPAHPGKFMATDKYIKLEELRRKYDPEGRFYSYIRVPREFRAN